MILNNMVLQKETLLELDTIDSIICKNFVLNKNNICLERIRFNLDGNSALHYFALDSEALSLVLDFMEEHKIGYLNAILMKNRKGESPIDITIKGESPKCTELLLRKLPLFKDSTLSSLFRDRFAELLNMNLQSFHKYLDSCFFQTLQMKKTKTLKLKSDADPLLVTHNNCLIDENFIEKYCIVEKKNEEVKDVNQSEGHESAQDRIENENTKTQDPKSTAKNSSKSKKGAKQKLLDIKGIEFDWIFSKEDGANFLKILSKSTDIELFSLRIVQLIIGFFWSYFRNAMIMWLLIPFLVYFVIFIMYATYFQKRKVEQQNEEDEDFGIGNLI